MKVTITGTGRTCPATKMLYGEVGRVVESDFHKGMIVLRTYDGLVDLEHPRSTWTNPSYSVQVFPPGTQITLTTEETQ